MNGSGEKVSDLDYKKYVENMVTEEYYAYIIAREFNLNPITIFQTWAYEDIYKTVSFLRFEAEQEERRMKELKNKRR